MKNRSLEFALLVLGGMVIVVLGIWVLIGGIIPFGGETTEQKVIYLEAETAEMKRSTLEDLEQFESMAKPYMEQDSVIEALNIREQSVEEEPAVTEEATAVIETESSSEAASVQESSATPAANESNSSRLIVIDAGHQAKGNSDKEPIGPGASEQKAKVASGTKGCVSGLYEYELTLMVSEKLCQELQNRGYEVLMVRTSHEVDISNAERAKVANEAGAAAFIRIHANGSDNAGVSGVETLCQTAANPYNAAYYEESRALSEQVLDGIIRATNAKKRRVAETDSMSGINWCQVPVTIVEMGFMTNEAEDSLMATEEYQLKLAQGMADGVDAYFELQ